ncbi:hypothetical protein BASA50_005538 [Batrachochytrium salamandrivorans]|uniref:GPI-anchored wall transfer protein n=1 Tax=Batrachochytrium salamandrivorans TaxID=1357716 RepID=A0ABQ8FCB4_9FUNG|nr:hypothetical protein BASA50_005538 [Batrachochytrium salamandrivorans]
MVRLDDSIKTAKQQHVQGHTGTTVWEIQFVLFVCLSSYLLWRATKLVLISRWPLGSKMSTFVLEFAMLLVPVMMSITVTSWTLYILVGQVATAMGLLMVFQSSQLGNGAKKTPASIKSQTKVASPTTAHAPFSVVFRAFLQMLTVAAILAVDFNVFPRRFAKTETFGVSLMDLGTGAFVFSSGLVSGPRINRSDTGIANKIYKTCGIFFPRTNFVALALVTMTGYEIFLGRGLQEYIFTAPRVDIISMNREGLCSMAGYFSIFLISAEIGKRILPQNPPNNLTTIRLKVLTLAVGLSTFAFWVCTDFIGLQASRRMANSVYVLWVVAACVSLLMGLFLIDAALSYIFCEAFVGECRDTPHLFKSVNRNQLATFAIANVFTGLINLSIDTLKISDIPALGIIIIYELIVSLLVALLASRS